MLRVPTVVTTTARDSMWGRPSRARGSGGGEHIIDRSSVNAWDDPKVAAAIEATGRKKLIFAGISLEVCAALPAITALGKGYEAYVAVDASGTFSETKRQAGLLRMQQAGVILSDTLRSWSRSSRITPVRWPALFTALSTCRGLRSSARSRRLTASKRVRRT